MYGNSSDTTCVPFEGADLADQLRIAVKNIHAELTEYERDELEEEESESIPADPNVRNFSFALVAGQIYYRENSRMDKREVVITSYSIHYTKLYENTFHQQMGKKDLLIKFKYAVNVVITSYSIHYTKLYDVKTAGISVFYACFLS